MLHIFVVLSLLGEPNRQYPLYLAPKVGRLVGNTSF